MKPRKIIAVMAERINLLRSVLYLFMLVAEKYFTIDSARISCALFG